ncbi:MAG: FHA domain-containing protein [bacterium]
MIVKICPSCGYKNKPNEILCLNCMSDISSVKVIDEALEKLKDKEEEKEANDKQLESVKKVLVLKEKKSGDILEVISGEVIGRAAKGAQLFLKLDNPKVISRLHCQIFFKDDKWYIRDMDSTNNTFLNGNKLGSAKEYELKEGDIINLAGVIEFEII